MTWRCLANMPPSQIPEHWREEALATAAASGEQMAIWLWEDGSAYLREWAIRPLGERVSSQWQLAAIVYPLRDDVHARKAS